MLELAPDRDRYLSHVLRTRGHCEPTVLCWNGSHRHLQRNSRAGSAPGRFLLSPISSLANGPVRTDPPRIPPLLILARGLPFRCVPNDLLFPISFLFYLHHHPH